MTPWLSVEEVDDLCAPLVQPHAKCRYLRSLGLTVKVKPNGQPLVMRSNMEAVLGGLPEPATKKRHATPPAPEQRQQVGPNVAGLRLVLSRG